jgi:SAM-dependent methyltransferase
VHLTHRMSCRICGSTSMTRVIDLGEQHLQGSFLRPGQAAPPQRRIPLVLMRCDPMRDEKACGLLQLAHTTPAELLYSSYWYRSGTNATMRDHLVAIAREAAALAGQAGCRVLDIGCNDGTLLAGYPGDFVKYGVDPSDIVHDARGPNTTVVQDLFPSAEILEAAARAPFDLVTSIAMFYDLEDPRAFVRAVRSVLAPEGLWVFEMSYMPLMLQMNSYDTICHEHIEYYSLAVLEYLLKAEGMKIVAAGVNDINGGSIRCYATHAANFKLKLPALVHSLQELRQAEFDLALDTDAPYRSFQERIDAHRQQLTTLLKRLKKEGKRIHAYGASTKGNVILQWCGIDHSLIDFAADRNPHKHGCLTLGSDIPIVSEEESRAMRPDYYLVLPWHFKAEFLEREKETLRAGTAMIFPLPEIQVVGER